MKIGVLNELLDNISFSYTFEDRMAVPVTKLCGDPLKNERFLVSWNEVGDEGIELHIDLKKSCFTDRVEIDFASRSELLSVILTNGKDTLSSYTAETGKIISQSTVVLEAGCFCQRLAIIVRGDFSNIDVNKITVYGALDDGAIPFFPVPGYISDKKESVCPKIFTGIYNETEAAVKGAKVLCEKFYEKTGVELFFSEDANVRLLYDGNICANGYSLKVGNDAITVKASDERGFVIGAEALIKLITDNGIEVCEIEDAPACEFRGVHLFLPDVKDIAFMKRLVKYMISPMGYNAVIIQVSAGMRFDLHPEINEAYCDAVEKANAGIYPPFPHSEVAGGRFLEKEQVADIVEYIRSFGIEVIPEVQSLGHVQTLTYAYPEIAEKKEETEGDTDVREKDARPAVFFPHCYCPSNERSYELLFDILTEIIEVFRPTEYVHMGHDEVYEIGVCPVCKSKSPAELFAYDINRIYDFLKARGLKMMIWADMLQPITQYKTPPAIDMIPRDILLLDFIWYFHLDEDIEDFLLEKDFKVAVGNLYSSYYPRYEKRIAKKGMVGGQISAWVATSEEALQREGKLYDIVMTAQMLWDKNYSSSFRLCYADLISRIMPGIRADLKGLRYPSLSKGAKKTVLLHNPISSVMFPPDVSVKQIKEFAVTGEIKSIIFHHTALRRHSRLPWTPNEVIGRYILQYDDGSCEELPITNCGNIGYWQHRHGQPLRHKLYRHSGYIATYYTDERRTRSANGEAVTLYSYEYVIPSGKVLRYVTLEEACLFDKDTIWLEKAEGVEL